MDIAAEVRLPLVLVFILFYSGFIIWWCGEPPICLLSILAIHEIPEQLLVTSKMDTTEIHRNIGVSYRFK